MLKATLGPLHIPVAERSSPDLHIRPQERRAPLTPAMLDVIARAEVGESEVDLIAQLHAVLAALEGPEDRLFTRYCARR